MGARWYEDAVYVKMCQKAYPIIGEKKPAPWDYWLLIYDGFEKQEKVMVVSEYTTDGGCYGPGLDRHWRTGEIVEEWGSSAEGYTPICPIWRQDQLQAMDIIDCPSHSACAILINLGYQFRQLCDGGEFHYWTQFTSMEQLWLAFVMWELHKKRWNGADWVEDKGELTYSSGGSCDYASSWTDDKGYHVVRSNDALEV